MPNYQLYHTNVYLGGQMKYDLVLSPHDGDLIVSDFHITPISPLIPFNKYVKENLLNYTHQENIKRFYKQISSRFYDQCIDPVLKSPYPIMSEYSGKLYDDTYEMGCRRMSYKLYNRQFEFLCPLWLERLDKDEYLNFEFSVYLNEEDSAPLARKNMILKPQEATGIHNRFVNYLNNYLEYIGVMNEDGIDSVFNIDPIRQISVVDGLNVGTGLNQVKQLPHLLTNLFSRELPLMEFDNTIIRSLQDNKLITKQLFNFNLCFNPDQLIPKYLLDMMGCSSFIVKVDVAVEKETKKTEEGEDKIEIQSQLLETRDLYSNYEYIPKKYCDEKAVYVYRDGSIEDYTEEYKTKLMGLDENEELVEPNVLDYLQDYKCVDYVGKNKMTQPIIHWSLCDNRDYIFNIYNGFGGYHLNNGNDIQSVNHKYDNAPNLNLDKYVPSQNTNCWCNMVFASSKNNDITSKQSTNRLDEEHLRNMKKYYSKFLSNEWNNSIKYENITSNHGHVYNLLVVGRVSVNIGFYNLSPIYLDNTISVYHFKDQETNQHYITFDIWGVTEQQTRNNMRGFTFSKCISLLTGITGEYAPSWVGDLLTTLKGVKNNTSVFIPAQSLDIYRLDTSVLQTSEIQYIKSDQQGVYVERYFGKIKPTFIDPLSDVDFNYKYERVPKIVDGVEDTEMISKIKRYSNHLKEPYYPSVGYFFMSKHREGYEGEERSGSEIHSFNYNIIRNFEPVLKWALYQYGDKDQKSYKKINELVRDELRRFYIGESNQTTNQEKELLDYIMSIYECNSSFDYLSYSESDIYNYRYDIKLTLK